MTRGTPSIDRAVVYAADGDQQKIENLRLTLLTMMSGQEPSLLTPDGKEVPVPRSISRVLNQVVDHMSRGDSITLIAYEREVTTQEAADILNMSRPSVIRLLDRGEIAHTKTGTHRRIKLHDVIEYKQRRSDERRAALRRITQLSDEMGDYE